MSGNRFDPPMMQVWAARRRRLVYCVQPADQWPANVGAMPRLRWLAGPLLAALLLLPSGLSISRCTNDPAQPANTAISHQNEHLTLRDTG